MFPSAVQAVIEDACDDNSAFSNGNFAISTGAAGAVAVAIWMEAVAEALRSQAARSAPA